MNQPYHLEEREHHRVELYYEWQSQICAPASLAIEKPQHCRSWLNGREVERTVIGYYVDPAIEVIALPKLQEGKNELKVSVD